MDKYIDLHLHTTASDGTYSPSDLVKLAHSSGLSAIAITDHDTIGGIQEGLKAGKEFSVEILSGIEISAEPDSGTMHILGYGFDFSNDRLNKTLERLIKSRNNRNEFIVEKCQLEGFNITNEELESVAGGDVVGRPHFAKLLVRKGYTKSTQEAFDKYLKKGAKCYVDKFRLSPAESIELIRQAGGIAVLAHPYTLEIDSVDGLEKYVENLKNLGIQGLEVFYPKHTFSQAAMYKSIAEKFGLFITGGSDFHGPNKPDVVLGGGKSMDPVPYEYLQRILTFLNGG